VETPKDPKVPTGTSPKLNEVGIHATLAAEDYFLTPNGMRSVCSLVLLACYDRKVEREFMADIIDQVTNISICLSDLECGSKMAHALVSVVDPKRDTAEHTAKLEGIARELGAKRKRLAEKFALVCQCHTGNDTLS